VPTGELKASIFGTRRRLSVYFHAYRAVAELVGEAVDGEDVRTHALRPDVLVTIILFTKYNFCLSFESYVGARPQGHGS
jgi:hypothetical protein